MRLFYLLAFMPFLASAELNHNLQNQLLDMAKLDQAVRKELTEIGWKNATKPLQNKLLTVDKNNTRKLKSLLNNRPWFTDSEVGKEGVAAAFLIIQHSPDYEFKEKMLPELKQSYLNGTGVTGQDVALLTDRVLIKKGQKQLYGTQADISKGKVIFKPILNPDSVDERRAEMKLPPLAQYKKLLEEMYGLKKVPTLELN